MGLQKIKDLVGDCYGKYLGVERSDFCRAVAEVGVFDPPLELKEEFSL